MFKFRKCSFVLHGLLQWHALLTEIKSWSAASNDVARGSSLAAFHLTVQLAQFTTTKRVRRDGASGPVAVLLSKLSDAFENLH
jgi:hypothetical protein